MLALAWIGFAAVVGSLIVIVDGALPGGPRLPDSAGVVPFGLAIVAFVGSLLLLSDYRLGRIRIRRIWAALMAAPLPAAAGVVVACTVLLVRRLAMAGAVINDPAAGTFVEGAMYFGAVAAALAYGDYRLRTSTGPAPARPTHLAVYLICAAILAFNLATAAGVVGILGRPIIDNRALHADIVHRFGQEPWAAHLVAANYEGGAYVYHFDTRDEVVLSAACRSLGPYDDARTGTGPAGQSSRPARLHFYRARKDVFVRVCPSASASPPPVR